jgi:RNA polymerase sigma-70 factor (ECF subfamily)
MMQGRDPDQHLWQRAQQRDAGAYDQLRRKYRALVNGSVRKWFHGASGDDLQDIEQDVWIAVWNALPNFRGDAAFNTWVVGIAKNVTFNYLRRKRTEAQAVAQVAQNPPREGVREGEMVSHLAVHEEIKNLGDSEREVIHLRYFAQLTDEEIAQKLETPLGTVKSRIRAGLAKLRAALEVAEVEDELA